MLGCFGLTQDSFTLCGALENEILKIGPGASHYNEICDYFENCRLWDHPCYEWNAILHIIHNLKDRFSPVTRPLWANKEHDRIQKFLSMHRNCGIFIRLALPESIIQPQPIEPQKEIMITAKRGLKLIKR